MFFWPLFISQICCVRTRQSQQLVPNMHLNVFFAEFYLTTRWWPCHLQPWRALGISTWCKLSLTSRVEVQSSKFELIPESQIPKSRSYTSASKTWLAQCDPAIVFIQLTEVVLVILSVCSSHMQCCASKNVISNFTFISAASLTFQTAQQKQHFLSLWRFFQASKQAAPSVSITINYSQMHNSIQASYS